jgi:hydroxymethylglutaryl-CoA reductase (NADPH)
MITTIPTKIVGPIKMTGDVQGNIMVPLATYETPLWPSVQRGAHLSQCSDGIFIKILKSTMSRSLLMEAKDLASTVSIQSSIQNTPATVFQEVVASTTSYGIFQSIDMKVLGPLLFIRVSIDPKEASGHNMVTKAAQAIGDFLCSNYSLKFNSVSGNMCCDKKVSAINAIQGRGHHVVAEMIVPKELCEKKLRCTAQQLQKIIYQKNWIGSGMAGSLMSANAHFSNMLLAFYLATGQDAANIIEGSQGMTYGYLNSDDDFVFSVTMPNLIIGSIGNGKHHDFVKERLNSMGCEGDGASKRLAGIAAATSLCGELSLLAALCDHKELVESHMRLERLHQKQVNHDGY